MTDYESFVASKLAHAPPTGLTEIQTLDYQLAPFQADLTEWALKRGRAAIFAATGLGKTRMQIAWADAVAKHTGGGVLILAPLAVAQQTVEEARKIGVEACVARDMFQVAATGISVTNYDRLHKFEPEKFAGVVLDESGIIKHHDAKTFAKLSAAFADTRFRLCATATPAPNDFTELGTHAEFLGVCSREEMLAEFMCHDGGDTSVWRLKKHARGAFWKWVASWGAMIRRPSDLGYDDGAYNLPPLHVHEHLIKLPQEAVFAQGSLFAVEAQGLMARRAARRDSMGERVTSCLDTVRAEPDETWIVWCELNDEQKALADGLGHECVSIYGTLDIEEKEKRLLQFMRGEKHILLSKPKIAGYGLNAQRAARMAFVGIDDSWEKWHQAIRREWRFGQTREVHVHVFAREDEGAVVRNLQRKEDAAREMGEALAKETGAMVREQVYGLKRETNSYTTPDLTMPGWLETHE
jgi:SNF2-related domain/Helicase conserved C-terminal domain